MEKLVRIKSQGALQQRNWTKQNGETVVISPAGDSDQSAAAGSEPNVRCKVQARREGVEVAAERRDAAREQHQDSHNRRGVVYVTQIAQIIAAKMLRLRRKNL